MSVPPTTRRKIKFYVLKGYEGHKEMDSNYLRNFLVDLRSNSIRLGKPDKLLLEYDAGINLYLSDIQDRGNVVLGEIGFLRIKDIPKGFDMRKYVSVNLPLGENQGILDMTHFAIFDNGVVAYEYFTAAPRPGSLKRYLYKYITDDKCGNDEECRKRIRILMKQLNYASVLSQLDDVVLVKSVDLRLKGKIPSEIAAAHSSLSRAIMNALPFLSELGRKIGFTITSGRSRGGIQITVDDILEFIDEFVEYLEKFKAHVVVRDGSRKEIDLMALQIQVEKEIRYETVDGNRNLRTTDRESAYRALLDAYRELEAQIKEALQSSSNK